MWRTDYKGFQPGGSRGGEKLSGIWMYFEGGAMGFAARLGVGDKREVRDERSAFFVLNN